MRIIIEIDGGELKAFTQVHATPTVSVSQTAPSEVSTAAAAIGATDAGPAPAGMMRISMETGERVEENILEPPALAKERALDAGSAPEDLLSLAMAEAPTEAVWKAPSIEAIDAGKPSRSLLKKGQGGIKND